MYILIHSHRQFNESYYILLIFQSNFTAIHKPKEKLHRLHLFQENESKYI